MNTLHSQTGAKNPVASHDDENRRDEYVRLLSRYRSLARSLSAADQRERDRLNGPLMQLYLELNPRSAYRHYDDIETVLRRETLR